MWNEFKDQVQNTVLGDVGRNTPNVPNKENGCKKRWEASQHFFCVVNISTKPDLVCMVCHKVTCFISLDANIPSFSAHPLPVNKLQ